MTSYNSEYTSGHYFIMTNEAGTQLIGVSFDYIYSLMETIPGTKLIISDFCYSGGFIEPNGITADYSLYSDTDVLNIFFSSGINVDHPSVYALTASSYFTVSQEYSSYRHGVFTKFLFQGLGWNDNNLAHPYQGTVLCKTGNEVTLTSLYNYIYENGGVTSTSADLVLFTF